MATDILRESVWYKDADGNSIQFRYTGCYYFHWLEDDCHNPVIFNPEDEKWWYANWDKEQHRFVPADLVSIASYTVKGIKGVYIAPDEAEQRYMIDLMQHQLSDQVPPIGEPLEAPPSYIKEHPQTSVSDSIHKDAQIQQSSSSAPLLDQVVVSYASSNTPIQPASIKRPLLLIYVDFANSTDTDKALTDEFIRTKLVGDTSTPGTVLHYYHTNLRGKAELSIFNNKIYRVTLPSSKAKRYGFGIGNGVEYQNTTGNFVDDLIYPALEDVIKNQGVQLFDNPSIQYPRTEPLGTSIWQSGGQPVKNADNKTIGCATSLYTIDPAICTPVILLHGQEAAAQYVDPSATPAPLAKEANVHAHVSQQLYWTVAFDWDGNLVQPYTMDQLSGMTSIPYSDFLYDQDDLDTVYDSPYTDDESFVIQKPAYKYVIKTYGIFGVFENYNVISGPSTMIHELGHALLDVMDLYDVKNPQRGYNSDDDIHGAGLWSVMAHTTRGPQNLDGFSIWDFNPRLTKPILHSGTYTISDVFEPHVILCRDNPNELFILQYRNFADSYDKTLADTIRAHFSPFYLKINWILNKAPSGTSWASSINYTWEYDPNNMPTAAQPLPANFPDPTTISENPYVIETAYPLAGHVAGLYQVNASDIPLYGTPTPGLLFQHANLTVQQQEGLTSGPGAGMLASVVEAHGGTQHLQGDNSQSSSKSPVTDTITVNPPSPYSTAVIDVSQYLSTSIYNTGDSADLFYEGTSTTIPAQSYWTKSGSAPFTISNISTTPTQATYTITFTQEPDDPDYDSLPEDPLRPANLKMSDTLEAPSVEDLSLSVDASTVNITLPNTGTVNLTVENALGAISYTASESWVTFSGSTATLAPTVAGTYSVTFTATDAGRTAASGAANAVAPIQGAPQILPPTTIVAPVTYGIVNSSGGNTATAVVTVNVASGASSATTNWTPRVWDTTGNVWAMTKSAKPNLAEKLCVWYKIPKGSTNIHFEIPYLQYDDVDYVDYLTQSSDLSASPKGKRFRDSMWPAEIPTVLRDLLDNTTVAEAVGDTDSTLETSDVLTGSFLPPYGYQLFDSVKLSDGTIENLHTAHTIGSTTQYPRSYHWLYFCRSHSASIQVFHTDGKLLSGTPLYNWDQCIGGADLQTHGGYVGGFLSPDVTVAGQAVWEHCGIWAEWYSIITAIKNSSSSELVPDMTNALPPTGTVVTPSEISASLKSLYPAIFSSSFTFSDTAVNGNRQEVLKMDDTTVKTISVDGETIKWTGSVGGATGLGAIDHRAQKEQLCYLETYNGSSVRLVINSKPYEVLDMDEAKEDLIIGVLSPDGFAAWGTWTDPSTPSAPVFVWLGDLKCWRNPDLKTV